MEAFTAPSSPALIPKVEASYALRCRFLGTVLSSSFLWRRRRFGSLKLGFIPDCGMFMLVLDSVFGCSVKPLLCVCGVRSRMRSRTDRLMLSDVRNTWDGGLVESNDVPGRFPVVDVAPMRLFSGVKLWSVEAWRRSLRFLLHHTCFAYVSLVKVCFVGLFLGLVPLCFKLARLWVFVQLFVFFFGPVLALCLILI